MDVVNVREMVVPLAWSKYGPVTPGRSAETDGEERSGPKHFLEGRGRGIWGIAILVGAK